MLNARWLLSSHSDAPITRPADVLRLAPQPAWKLGFLQHGVIKDDLSPWLNQHDHDLFVVSTVPERESIAADGTSYAVTRKEVRLTGLPRFDRLLRRAAEVAPDDRNLVIVGPTWRSSLALPLERGTQRRDLRSEFWDSDYVQRWLAILDAPELAEALRERGWRLGFMPHPNLQEAFGQLQLPDHVTPLSFAGSDVQGLYARLGLLVTDYSSVAFNAAYLDRPTVYYQFDRDELLAGGHVGRPGYFDYERDGFGPVAVDHEAAVSAIVAAIRHGADPGAALRRPDRRDVPGPGRPRLRARRRGDRGAEPALGGRLRPADEPHRPPDGAPIMRSMASRDPQSSVDERGSDPTPSAGRPVVSIVSAVFDVARYLPDFIASIERQGAAPGVLEVVAVDDGSTDGSLQVLEAWRDRAPFPVTVLHQANAGQSAARNLGLEHATGEWVTFTDPDDMLAPGFLDAILRFVGRHPDVALVASMPVVVEERTGREHRHARHRQYAAGDRVVDLDREPSTFGGSSSVSFFRLDRVRAAGLRFDPRVRPNFEDGHFAVRYVLELAEPRIGVVPSARYLYRRRADGTSSVQRSHGDPGRYTAVFEHGYLDVIARAKARHARLPAWLQQVLVYELTWYLMEDERLTATAILADDIVAGVPRAPRRRPAGAGPGRRRRPPGPAPQAELARHLQPCRPTGAVAVADGRRHPRRRGHAPRAGDVPVHGHAAGRDAVHPRAGDRARVGEVAGPRLLRPTAHPHPDPVAPRRRRGDAHARRGAGQDPSAACGGPGARRR